MDFIIEELDLTDSSSVKKFKDFYNNIFTKCFSKDEIGAFEDYFYIKKEENEDYTYHLSFAEVNGRYVACFIYCLFPKIQMMVGEFACVDERYRRLGLASALMHSATKQHNCKWLFGEIEKDNAFNLSTWKRYGFKKIPVDYVQLSLGEGRKPVSNLALCVLPLKNQVSISSNDVRSFVYNYYRWSQLYADPTNTTEYQNLCNDCKKQAFFSLEQLTFDNKAKSDEKEDTIY